MRKYACTLAYPWERLLWNFVPEVTTPKVLTMHTVLHSHLSACPSAQYGSEVWKHNWSVMLSVCRSVPYVLSRSGTNDQRLSMYVVCMCSDFDNFNKGINKLLFLLSADRRRSQMNCVSGRGAWDDELQYRFRDLTTDSYFKAQWLSLIVRCSECYFSVVVSPHCNLNYYAKFFRTISHYLRFIKSHTLDIMYR